MEVTKEEVEMEVVIMVKEMEEVVMGVVVMEVG